MMPNQTSSVGRSWSTSQLAWSCIGSLVAGAALLYAVGFYWVGQWQTGDEVARKIAVAACVEDFLLQSDRGVIHAELQSNTSAYQRRQLIQKNQWAKEREVADLCDQRIRAFDPSLFPPPAEATEEAAVTTPPA
jgi:hypothetical protein